eukprot:scaffold74117_cov61-Phaeocystis_antarctica.AAC.5
MFWGGILHARLGRDVLLGRHLEPAGERRLYLERQQILLLLPLKDLGDGRRLLGLLRRLRLRELLRRGALGLAEDLPPHRFYALALAAALALHGEVLLEGSLLGLVRHVAQQLGLRKLEARAEGAADRRVEHRARDTGDGARGAGAHVARRRREALGLLLGVHHTSDGAHHHERRARRLGLVGRRPLSAGHLGRVLPQVGGGLGVEHLVRLVVLVDRVPAAARAAAAADLAVGVQLVLAPLARAAVP